MGRELPAGLSDAQRAALSEFYTGHISAGQLTHRLGLEEPTPTHDSSRHQSSVEEMRREEPRDRPVTAGTAPRRRGGMKRCVEGLLRLTPRRTGT